MADNKKPVVIKSVNGENKSINVDLSANCNVLIDEAKRAFGVTNNVILTFGGKELKPENKILSYGITKFSNIAMAYTVPGGNF